MKNYDQIKVSIVDYGLGNLFSIKHAWNHIGVKSEITSSKDTILNSNLVVLPGVGAFADAMYSLNALVEFLHLAWVQFLGLESQHRVCHKP